MDREAFGKRLKAAIGGSDLSQADAQEQLKTENVRGASRANFYKILGGERSPSADFLEGVSRLLGVSVDWLLTGKGEMWRRVPMNEEQVEYRGLLDLPEAIRGEVDQLALNLHARTDRTGQDMDTAFGRIAALCRGIAAWIRLPLHSEKLRSVDSDIERTAYADAALRALRMLIPDEGEERPGDIDTTLSVIEALERELAGREKPPVPDVEPELPAEVRTALATGRDQS